MLILAALLTVELGGFLEEMEMETMDDLFDVVNSSGLCSACAGTGRVYEGERCQFCEETEPSGFAKSVSDDCAELVEIAGFLEAQGKKSNGEFLRHIAECHWSMFSALKAGDNMSPSFETPNAKG